MFLIIPAVQSHMRRLVRMCRPLLPILTDHPRIHPSLTLLFPSGAAVRFFQDRVLDEEQVHATSQVTLRKFHVTHHTPPVTSALQELLNLFGEEYRQCACSTPLPPRCCCSRH